MQFRPNRLEDNFEAYIYILLLQLHAMDILRMLQPSLTTIFTEFLALFFDR